MRPRPAFMVLAAIVLASVLLIPLVPTELPEASENDIERGSYVTAVIVFSVIGFFSWMSGYYQRGGGIVGLLRYVVGNVFFAGALMIVLIMMWEGAQLADELLCVFGVAPLVWLGAVLARWNVVKGDVPDAAYVPKPKHGKQEPGGFEPGRVLHGHGSEVSLPVSLESGTYRLGYSFPDADTVAGCEVVLSNVDNPNMEKRSIAVPESTTGGIVFAAPETAHYVFEVDGVNEAGESLTWELIIDRL